MFCLNHGKHGVPISHLARRVKASDFTEFTHILAADENNLRDLQRMKPNNGTADVRLWGSYLDNKPIPDPYYGGMVRLIYCLLSSWVDLFLSCLKTGFQRVFEQCNALSTAFLDEVSGHK